MVGGCAGGGIKHVRKRILRWVAIIGLTSVVLLLVAVAGLGVGGSSTLPKLHQTARIAGVSAPVLVSFDQDGVPRIRAENDLDAAAALGFVHARDRMFQMELTRRVGSGRVSEIAGSAGLRSDELMRTLGLRARAQADLALMPPHVRALLGAYADGVNTWIARRGRFAAPEFVVLGAPEPWTPVDSLLWGKVMTLYLSGNYRTELDRASLARRIPPGLIDALWPPAPQPLGPQAENKSGRAASVALADWLPRFPAPFTLPATASNEWAVDGAHSATGAPILAGDPHLALGLPGYWYLARIDTPQGVLAGATAPGMPFLVIGRNAHIAWTFTTTGTDTQDIFVETPVDDGHYMGPNGPLPYVSHDEVIHVRGGADHRLHVRETRHGPVISDVDGVHADGEILAVAMAGLAKGDTAAAGLAALNQAQDLNHALAAAPLITSPNQNLLAADAHRIGVAVTGRVPIRADGDGSHEVDGASGLFDWTGYASGAQLPHVVAPASGRLVNGNERIAPADFPVFMGRDSYGDWRSRRIRTLLDQHPQASVRDFVAMQTDVVSTFAQQLLPVMRAVHPASKLARRALALLDNWDGAMRREQPQPLIFEAWVQRFAINLLDQAGVPTSLAGPRAEFVASVLTGDNTVWCNGDCSVPLTAALEQSTAELARSQGSDPAAWRWGRVHRAVFAHPILGRLPLIGRFASRRISTSGGDATVGRAAMPELPSLDFEDVHAAAYRGVYDLDDLDRSRFMVAPGQSGNLFSRHVGDFIMRWRNGQTISLGPKAHHIHATLIVLPVESGATGDGR
jgi:penicillin amidase